MQLKKVRANPLEIVCPVTGGEGQRVCPAHGLERLDKYVKPFKWRLVDTSDEHCNLGLYMPRSLLLDHMADVM